MTDCNQVQEQLSEYMNGALLREPRLLATVETHLEKCASCRKEADDLRSILGVLHTMPPLEPPAYLVHAIRARIQDESRAAKPGVPLWLFPNRQGFAVRLAAVAAIGLACVPTVRDATLRAPLGLLGAAGVVKQAAHTEPASTANADGNKADSKDGNKTGDKSGSKLNSKDAQASSAGADNSASRPGKNASSSDKPAGPATVSSTPATTPPVASVPSPGTPPAALLPLPIQRPTPPEAHILFDINGSTRPGDVVWVNVSVLGNRDFPNSVVDASVSGGHFVSESGASAGSQKRLWSGNLAVNLPTSLAAPLQLDRAGVGSLHVMVRCDQGILASSSLLIPDNPPASNSISIQTPSSGADLYSAAGAWAAQSGHPLALEDGLKGTRPFQLKAKDSESALSTIASEFQVGLFHRNGIDHLILFPEQLANHGVSRYLTRSR